MNILYIGPYRQQDGWGEASRDFVIALSKSDHNIAVRPIYMGQSRVPGIMPQPFSSLENKRIDKYDAVIQHVLPAMFEHDGRFEQNIGMFYSETGGLQHTPWIKRCNFMDSIIVSSDTEKYNLKSDGVIKPISKINVPVETAKFAAKYEKLIIPAVSKTFNFYFIGEYIQRKNLPALVLAFHMEFGINEPVNLVIKTNKGGVHPGQLRQMVTEDINHIKQAYRIYASPEKYKQEVIITEYLSELDMCKLHSACDCFVMPSHGEAWCRPAIDAMGFGKTPIVTQYTGMDEFVDEGTGFLVPSHIAPVLASDPPIGYLYTANETWRNINILELRKAMRKVYEDSTLRKSKAENGKQRVLNYSYDKIAEQINESIK